jgi:hypothetical protein
VIARIGVGVLAVLLILIVLLDVFDTIVLPRRASIRVRTTTLVYRLTWTPWAALARRLPPGNPRENLLAYYGPLLVLFLLAAWTIILLVSYAGLQWAFGSQLNGAALPVSFWDDLYYSATTFFTLGLGDLSPQGGVARAISIVEVANGFGLIALVIGYMPSLYQSFSRREVNISLLDARAGSPPTAIEFLRRLGADQPGRVLEDSLRDWERWAADILESHISYPALCHFRSQHDNQSWVSALSTILDVCALALSGIEGAPLEQAQLTFAIARHAAVDLSQVLRARPAPSVERMPVGLLDQITMSLRAMGVHLPPDELFATRLAERRLLYEPYIAALSEHLLMPLPDWLPTTRAPDDWQTSTTRHFR